MLQILQPSLIILSMAIGALIGVRVFFWQEDRKNRR